MRTLTFHGFLRNYLKQLSGAETESVSRLLEMAQVNPRLRAPLVLYIKATLPKQRVERLQQRHPLLADELDQHFAGMENETDLLRSLQTGVAPDEYQKVYRSYLAKRDRVVHEQDLKGMVQTKIKKLAEEKKVSDYRVYKDLGINSGNYHAFVYRGNVSKLGLEKARQVLEYLESQG